ncbi:MAG TPA: NAD(P)-binding domain-containing protein [Usitatibacter sp.]|nr:NAD(P)-binding domain-containing protein [Usitatibacter sp.]
MTERIETVVIGGGQAGLAMSHHLRERGCEHLVLERARVAERWRTQRWDSLMFQLPNWSLELPGHAYAGDAPEEFSHKDAILAFIEDYARRIQAPVRSGVEVLSVQPAGTPACYRLETNTGTIEARNVVLATGPYQRARVPAAAAELPADVVQVHASDYRSPGALPPGAVLVVGSGASGCQIAEELLLSGRTVYFAIGRHRRVPRRYRGRDVFWWRRALGHLDQTVDETPPERRFTAPLVTGVGGGHDIDIREYREKGMTLLGHVRAIRGGRIALAGDLEENLRAGDREFREFHAAVDDYVARVGLDAPAGDAERRARPANAGVGEIRELDLRAAGIRTVVWATGYSLDFGWVKLPVFGERGEPLQRRGVAPSPGLYFLGLTWMHKVKSSFLYGVGEDAQFIAERIRPARGHLTRRPGSRNGVVQE